MSTFFWMVEYCVSFVESLMALVYMDAFEIRKTKKYVWVLISFFMALGAVLLVNNRVFSTYNTMMIFAIMYVVCLICFDTKRHIALLLEISYFALIAIADFITSSMVAYVVNSNIANLFNEFSHGRVVAAIASKGILVVFCVTLNRINRNRRNNSKRIYILLGVISIASLAACAVVYFYMSNSNEESTNIAISYSFAAVLITMIILHLCIIGFLESQRRRQELEFEKQKAKMFESMINEQEKTMYAWEKSIHDYKHTVLAIDVMLSEKRYGELEKYVEEEKRKFDYKAGLIKTGNRVLDSVINVKYILAREKGIPISVSVNNVDEIKISDVDMVSIVGNILDNAIEAQDTEEEKYIEVQIKKINSIFMIKVVNACNNSPKTMSTKKRDSIFHGIGLKSVFEAVEKNNGECSLEFVDKQAVVLIMIPEQ